MPFSKELCRDLFVQRKAIVFCGAGISIEPPAGLPDWKLLRDYTLEAVACDDELLLQYLPLLKDVAPVSEPGDRGLTPELVASKVYDDCSEYLTCFRVLEDGQPNRNHKYLAYLCKLNNLKYIITTNFDVFIEDALRDLDVPYRLYRTDAEFSNFDVDDAAPAVHIFKLHGCITAAKTILATVEQQGNGLSQSKARVLERLLSRYYFVFWGSSGADLRLDLDYFRMVSSFNAGAAAGFVWSLFETVDYKEAVSPYVAALATLYGPKAFVAHGMLPGIFDALIPAELHQAIGRRYNQNEQVAWQQQKNKTLNQGLAAWARQYLRRTESYGIFGTLLEHIGRLEEALRCYERYADEARRYDDVVPVGGAAINNIGEIYRAKGDYERALSCYETARKLNQKCGNDLGCATQLNNIGLVHNARGEHEQALEYFSEAAGLYRTTDDERGLATAIFNKAVAYARQCKEETAMACCLEAEQLQRNSGDKLALADTLTSKGCLHYAHHDCDAALRSFKEAETIQRGLRDKKRVAILLMYMGDCYKEQGALMNALRCLKEAEEIERAYNDKDGIHMCCVKLALTYKALGDLSNAVRYLFQADEMGIANV